MARNSNDSPIEIQEYLKGVHYPADKESLSDAAEENGAPEEILELLKRLPGSKFKSPAEVMKAYGEINA